MSKRPNIRDLHGDAITVTAREYNFGEGYADTWEYYEACKCDGCGQAVGPARQGDCHGDIDDESECEGSLSGEGPMIHYWWHLPEYRGNALTDCLKLVDLPVCIVENLSEEVSVEESYGLALTGGGMDLSWELAEAYMRLGYLPPFRLADLPAYAGLSLDTRRRWIVAGCKATCRAMIDRGRRGLRTLQHLRKSMATT